ncbi:unnamed protein product [Victoria cruziana]
MFFRARRQGKAIVGRDLAPGNVAAGRLRLYVADPLFAAQRVDAWRIPSESLQFGEASAFHRSDVHGGHPQTSN